MRLFAVLLASGMATSMALANEASSIDSSANEDRASFDSAFETEDTLRDRRGGRGDSRPGGGIGRPGDGRPGGGWGRPGRQPFPFPIPIPIPVPGGYGYEVECTAAQESVGWGRTFTAIASGRTQSEAYANAENRVLRQCNDSSNGRYRCRIVSCRPYR